MKKSKTKKTKYMKVINTLKIEDKDWYKSFALLPYISIYKCNQSGKRALYFGWLNVCFSIEKLD